MSEFKREPRYLVFKIKDMQKYLPFDMALLTMLNVIGDEIATGRKADGKAPFNALVVEQDWPEFEPTWAAIEKRMTPDYQCPICDAPDFVRDFHEAVKAVDLLAMINTTYEDSTATEREACAKVCEEGRFLHDQSLAAQFGRECAAAIRRRTINTLRSTTIGVKGG